jgi:hypothetical protein
MFNALVDCPCQGSVIGNMAKCQFLPKRCFSFCLSPINDAAQGRAMDGPLTKKGKTRPSSGAVFVVADWITS